MTTTKKGGEQSPPKSYDYTSTARAQRRRKGLDTLAQSVGFETTTKFLTAWLNGKIKVSIERVDA